MANGLYDPVLDVSDDYYVSNGPDDLDQAPNLQQVNEVQIDSKESTDKSKSETEFAILLSSKPYRPLSAGPLQPVILNLNYKHVFPELDVEILPSEIKYKLPVSDQYDPEGKKVTKLQELYKNIIVDVEKISITAHENVTHTKEGIFNKDVYDSIFERQEVSKDEHEHFKRMKEEIDLDKIEETASYIVDDSLDKAVSVANQIKTKLDVELSKSVKECKDSSKIHKQSIQTEMKSYGQSNMEKEQSDFKQSKLFIKGVNKIQEISSGEAIQKEVSVAKDVKKFEAIDINMDSKLSAEVRKLLTQQDIEEAIEAGTVRQRTEMFRKGTDRIMLDKFESKAYKESDVKTSNIQQIKQRVYATGLQIIPNLLATAQTSQISSRLLKKFIIQLTKVMITIYRFIPVEAKHIFMKIKESYDEKKEGEAFERGTGIIKKPKLSGAKIAQIQGLKPAELTKKMNIVISEFLRKSGKEEILEEKEFRRSRSRSKSESRIEEEIEEEILRGSSFKQKNIFSDKKLVEETYESKTQSLEIREMKTEKRFSESFSKKTEEKKTSIFDSNLQSHEKESRGDNNLIYIAIVEAHVYTNKNAIFEEQMRQMAESHQSEKMESSTIYYKCEVSVTYRDFRESSLQPTVVIESIEEIPSEEVFEEKSQAISQKSSTGFEEIAKKLAVQKITQVIEPILKLKEVKSVNIKQAYPVIEMPLKLIAETATITMEKEKNILPALKVPTKKSLVCIETTAKPIAETTEILVEEEKIGVVDFPQPILQKPRHWIESTMKSVAETNEVIVDEANVKIFDVPKLINVTPRCTIADNLRAVAETVTVITEEPKSHHPLVLKTSGEAVKVRIDETMATEIFEVVPEEPVYEEIVQSEIEKKQSDVGLEKPPMFVSETTMTSVEESCEQLFVSSDLIKEAKMDISPNIVAEITEVYPIETEQNTFDLLRVTPKEPEELKEELVLTVGETSTIFPFEPKAELFEISKLINQQASVTIEESKATETTMILAEETKERNLEVLEFTKNQRQPFIENKILTAAETLSIIPEEPEISFKINKTLDQKAHIGFVKLKATGVTSVCLEEPKEEILETYKIQNIQPKTNMEMSVFTVAESITILPQEPNNKSFEIPKFEVKRPQTLMENSGLVVAETLAISSNSPESENFEIIEKINEQANIRIDESKATITSHIHIEEPKEEKLELTHVKEKQLQISLHDTLLTVAATSKTFSEEPNNKSFITPQSIQEKVDVNIEGQNAAITTIVCLQEPKNENLQILPTIEKQSQSLIERPVLIVAETLTTLPEGPRYGGFDEVTVTRDQANIVFAEMEPLLISSITPSEFQGKELEIPQIEEKHPKTQIEEHFLTVVETSAVVPEESKIETYDIFRTAEDKAKVNVEVYQTAEATEIIIGEPKAEVLKLLKYEEKQPLTSIERCNLIVPETLEITPDESKNDSFTVPATKYEKVNIKMKEYEGTTTTIVNVEEPKEENLYLPTIKAKQQQPTVEGAYLSTAQTLLILPEEFRATFEVPKTTSQPVRFELVEQKAAEIMFVFPLEADYKDFVIPETVKIMSQLLFQESALTVAENSIICSEEKLEDLAEIAKTKDQRSIVDIEGLKVAVAEIIIILSLGPKDEILNISKTAMQQAQFQFEESIAAETTVYSVEEFLNEEFIATGINTKLSDHYIEKSVKTVAVVTAVNVNDMESIFSTPSQTVSKEVKITFELLIPLAQTTIILYEDAASYVSKISKLASNKINIVIVKSSAVSVANITCVTVIKEETVNTTAEVKIQDSRKFEAIEVSKLTKKLEEKESAVLKVIKQEIVDVTKDDLSISSASSISSAPSPPLIEEYVFGVMGHEYRVQSPQETSLEIKKTYKDSSYEVQNLDTSYTLTIEAAAKVEEEIEVVDISKYSVELAEEHEEIESATLEAVKQEIVEVIKEDLRSSSPSSVSSASSTPLIEEYVFGVMGHEYRVQSPQETSLDVKKTYKDSSYEVQNLDTSFTLTIQADAEFEKGIQITEEEVSNIDIRKSQFWISDIKTTESVESSDTNIQLINVNVESDAHKVSSQSKYLLAQDLNLVTKSRAQSFDQSADFEVSLQSLELEAKAKALDSQEMTMFDFKSKASFRTLEDVQSEANIKMKSKETKSFGTETVDVAYGLTIESEAAMAYDQSMESDIQTSQESKTVKSSKRRVKKGASKVTSADVSEIDAVTMASASALEMQANRQSSSSAIASKSISTGTYSAAGESIESIMEGNVQLSDTSHGRLSSVIQENLVSTGSSVSSVDEMSSRFLEMGAKQTISLQTDMKGIKTEFVANADARKELSLQIGLRENKIEVFTPDMFPSTPLTDEYIFRLQEPMPDETEFIPRDCSFSPDSIHEDSLVIVNGMIPHIDTKIVRILYSPPLQTPPTTFERKAEPVFSKPGLKGGAEIHEFTKEEILEIERDSALLASAIDRTIRSIEEYKESVGIAEKKEATERDLNEEQDKVSKIIGTDQLAELSVAETDTDDEDISKPEDNQYLTKKFETELSDKQMPALISEESISAPNSIKRNKSVSHNARKSIQLLSRFSQI